MFSVGVYLHINSNCTFTIGKSITFQKQKGRFNIFVEYSDYFSWAFDSWPLRAKI